MPGQGHAEHETDTERTNPTFERWLSCTYKSGTLGVAFYDKLTNKARRFKPGIRTPQFLFEGLAIHMSLASDPESLAEGRPDLTPSDQKQWMCLLASCANIVDVLAASL